MKLGFSAGWPGSHPGFGHGGALPFPRALRGITSAPSRFGRTEALPPSSPDVSSGALPSHTARMAGQDILKQIDTKSKQSSGFYRPAVCVQLKKFIGWLLHSFKIASLGERAEFTYKYPFCCKESAFSGLPWKGPSSWLIPTITWEGFSKHTNVQHDGDTKCWFRHSGEGQNPVKLPLMSLQSLFDSTEQQRGKEKDENNLKSFSKTPHS